MGAELVVFQQCGHLPHIEQPEAFVHTVVQYLARLAR
jgi:pimeloyl-ACP methyl ester carboxylesterase